jgi:hypothetical protein
VIVTNNFATDKHSGVWMNTNSLGQIAIGYGRATGGSSDPDRRTKIGTTVLQPDTWYLLVGVVRGATDMDLYVDCINDGGSYAGTCLDPIGYTSDAGSVGRKDVSGVSPYHFQGSIDDLRYWNRALEPADIDHLCQTFVGQEEIHNQALAEDILIYPNPVHHFLYIEKASYAIQSVEMVDASGKTVLAQTLDASAQIDVSELNPGYYFVQFYTPEGILPLRKKVIIE